METIVYEKGKFWISVDNGRQRFGEFKTEQEAKTFLTSKPTLYIYSDQTYKETHGEYMIYAYREYPYGHYVGHFKALADAEEKIKELKPYRLGLKYHDALIDFQNWPMHGLELIEKVGK